MPRPGEAWGGHSVKEASGDGPAKEVGESEDDITSQGLGKKPVVALKSLAGDGLIIPQQPEATEKDPLGLRLRVQAMIHFGELTAAPRREVGRQFTVFAAHRRGVEHRGGSRPDGVDVVQDVVGNGAGSNAVGNACRELHMSLHGLHGLGGWRAISGRGRAPGQRRHGIGGCVGRGRGPSEISCSAGGFRSGDRIALGIRVARRGRLGGQGPRQKG